LSDLYSKLINICPEDQVMTDEPMSLHTTFKVGGPADFYVVISQEEQLQKIITLCRNESIDYYVIGNGSNLLVRDEGFRGVIIEVGSLFADITVDGERITARAGALMSRIASVARDASLTGFEFASGIPGTIGGGCIMNAGAYDGEIKNVLEKVRLMDTEGNIHEEDASGLSLSYRHSNIPEREMIVLSATIKLEPGDRDAIAEKMKELNARRVAKQPLEYPSAGSTFKRPAGYFAGKLIEDAGMRGYRVGGAQVSEKHCGFVINTGDATAADIWLLTCDVREAVLKTSGVLLEREIKLL